MNALHAVALAATALTLGCAAATAPHALPEEVHFDRIRNPHVDVETAPTLTALLRELPRALSKHGYFILRSEPGTAEGLRFYTDWQPRNVYAEESFAGVQQARTRLVVDARRRGTSYAVSIYAVSLLEDASGAWRPAAPSREIRSHLREVGAQLALDTR